MYNFNPYASIPPRQPYPRFGSRYGSFLQRQPAYAQPAAASYGVAPATNVVYADEPTFELNGRTYYYHKDSAVYRDYPPEDWEEGSANAPIVLDGANDNFYKAVNSWWLNDASITIPPEYPRWGSFIILVDESLKAQTKLLEEVLTIASPSADERRLALVWKASLKRFSDWEAGRGDTSAVQEELQTLQEHANVDDAEWAESLAKWCAHCNRVGIGSFMVFDKETNLEDANNVVLDFGAGSVSLPNRDYYTEEKFAEQRGFFKDHLAKLVGLVEDLPEDFAERVFRFETKLAQIKMKSDQSRQFDSFYTVSTLDTFAEEINELKHLPAKEENYTKNVVEDGDADTALLTEPQYKVSDDEKELIASFMDTMDSELGLRRALAANYKANYPDSTDESAVNRFMVFDGDYFRRVFTLITRPENKADVLAFLQYKVLRSASTMCTKELDEEFFDFNSRKLQGQKEMKSAEKRSVAAVNAMLGELLGKIYVSRFLEEKDKDAVGSMVDEVLSIMGKSLEKNDWLTDETKQKALEKLRKFRVKIGYPDKWKSYDNLHIEDDDSLYAINKKVEANEFEVEFLQKINSPKDLTKWEMTPQTVNAYFHPLNNEIVFPAAILQPPFYCKSLDLVPFDVPEENQKMLDAVNFGAIGAVIAHEITHGYDDQGKKFDSEGNINNWWREEDEALFQKKTAQMATQAEAFVFVPEEGEDDEGEHKMNPQLTMGENLADLGGLSLALQALQDRYGSTLTKANVVAFFQAWANVWKSKQSDQYAKQALATDPHAPAEFRGNLVNNIDEFYDTFDVRPGDGMYLAPEDRVRMW